MQLQELFDYKNKLMEDLLTNEKIVKLINDDIAFEDAASLAYTQVFPCEYVPETAQEGKTYVCFDVDISETVNKTYLLPKIYIWVFAHRSRLRLPEGGVRTDALCAEIANTINGSRMYGLGELNLYSVRRFAPMTDYQGKVMCYDTCDINRLYENKKPVPTNRRNG